MTTLKYIGETTYRYQKMKRVKSAKGKLCFSVFPLQTLDTDDADDVEIAVDNAAFMDDFFVQVCVCVCFYGTILPSLFFLFAVIILPRVVLSTF